MAELVDTPVSKAVSFGSEGSSPSLATKNFLLYYAMESGYKIIDNVLNSRICRNLIEMSEEIGYQEADLSLESGAEMRKDRRDNARALYSDETLRMILESLIWDHAPQKMLYIAEGGAFQTAKLLGLSGKFRFYRYYPGEQFKRHRDSNQEERHRVSLVTVLFYLNTPEEGGETYICDNFLEYKPKVEPVEGRCLMFDHALMHSGEPLIKGKKYVLRTDLLYRITK